MGMSPGEALHHAAAAPRPLGQTGLMETLDPETGQPYCFLPNDVSRQLAIRQGMLDPSASNPTWFAETASSTAVSGFQELSGSVNPPLRAEYPLGAEGQEAYRMARADWYLSHTGERLMGTIAEQNDA